MFVAAETKMPPFTAQFAGEDPVVVLEAALQFEDTRESMQAFCVGQYMEVLTIPSYTLQFTLIYCRLLLFLKLWQIFKAQPGNSHHSRSRQFVLSSYWHWKELGSAVGSSCLLPCQEHSIVNYGNWMCQYVETRKSNKAKILCMPFLNSFDLVSAQNGSSLQYSLVVFRPVRSTTTTMRRRMKTTAAPWVQPLQTRQNFTPTG